MVKPIQLGRVRPLLSSESSDPSVSGDDYDWDAGGYAGEASVNDQWKQPVRAATTASVTISTALNNGDTLDGVTLATGDRVLVKDQSAGAENGMYIVGATPDRAPDFDDDDEVLGALVYVIAGTTNAATAWKVTNTAAVTVGSTSIVFAAFGSGGALTDHTHAATGSGSNGGGATLSPGVLNLPTATSPAQTADGSAVWDSDDDKLTIGTGAARKTLVNEGAVTSSGLTQATGKLLGRNTASTGAIEEITLGTNLSFTGTTLNAAGGGGGATDYYSGTSGTGQIVIPGLQVADRQPASPNAKDDEFTALSGWTSLGTLDTSNVSDAVSHWHAVKAMPNSVVTHGIYKAAPSMPFTLWTKLSDAIIDTDYQGYGFVLTESAPGKCTTFHVIHDGTVGRFAMYKFTNNTTFSASTNGTGYAMAQRTPLYMKLLVTSSTDVTLSMSWDGLYYRAVGISNLNPNLTVANFGLALVTAGGSVTCDGYFDYIRVT